MELTPQSVLWAYAHGYFPMADSRDGPVRWYTADPRCVLPFENLRVTRSLRKVLRSRRFRITADAAFERVVRACAQPRVYSDETWINHQIIDVYTQLHEMGFGHSVESWLPDEDAPGGWRLVGGLYGLAIGGAFFGESMFSTETDASKVCLVRLIERLEAGGFVLLDAQTNSPHMTRMGAIDVPMDRYMALLHAALDVAGAGF